MLKSLPVNMKQPDPFNANTIAYNQKRYDTLKEVIQRKARAKHLNFIHYMWNNPSEPFTIGLHTRIICQKIDEAMDKFARNKSVFLVMAVPFRHGKAFAIDTPVLTVTGWKKHGELKPGDFVFNPKGNPVEVQAITGTYLHALRKITFFHGEELYASPEHEWLITYKNCKGQYYQPKRLETRQIRFAERGQTNRQKRYLQVLIDRQKESNELAAVNNGIVIPGNMARIIRIDTHRRFSPVNCIQVDGGLYLAGKGLIPASNSEILSRKLPAHFLGLFPDSKIIMTGHTASLSVSFSKDSRNLLMTEKYKELFPDTQLNPIDAAASHWKVNDRNGEVFACGLGSSLSGQGYHLGIVDDYCRNRADAESPTMREKMWNSFTNDFLTRRAPRSITIVTATPWHVDDIIGRIKKQMLKDPSFPKFEFAVMPAFSDEYEHGILFPERFNKAWYEEQRAALGEYGTASLLQCNPVAAGGNILQVDKVQRIKLEEFPNIPYARIWDLAHTEKQRTSPDPDYTSGTLFGMRRKPGAPKQWQIFVKDVIRFRLDAPKRDNKILNVTQADGPYVKVGIENSIDSKDAFKHLQNILLGQRIVQQIQTKGDKVIRASALEPIFESGDVFVPEKAPWFQAWVDELLSFPAGSHDDQVDNLSAGYAMFNKTGGAISVNMYGI